MSPPGPSEGLQMSVPILVEVLELCRQTWIRDFLFKMEPTADVGILTSPTQLKHATVLDEVSSGFETAGQYSGMFDVVSSSRWLVVPVFNVDRYSAELIIMSKETKSNPLFHAGGMQNIIRVVRNNSTGDALMSFDNHKYNTLTVWSFKQETKMRRKRAGLHGKRQPFLQSLLSPTGIDFPKIMKSLTMLVESQEVYSCPMCCYATPGARCTCPKEFKLPRHPLDFTYARENLLNHCGCYTGSSAVNLLNMEFPVPFTRAMLASMMDIKPCTELGLVPAIVDLSIKTKMSENCVVPAVMSRPAVDGDVGMSVADPTIVSRPDENSLFVPGGSSDGFASAAMRNDVRERNNLSLAAACDPPPFEGTSIGTSGADIELSGMAMGNDDEEERKRNRKLRNREAAQRSNLKRKERYETLIENVSAIRRTKAELLEREKELKNENENLRVSLNRDDNFLFDL